MKIPTEATTNGLMTWGRSPIGATLSYVVAGKAEQIDRLLRTIS